MYCSLLDWLNVPYTIKPFISRTVAGTKVFGETLASMCYPEADVKLVTDSDGAEKVSTTQLYVPGAESINVLDNVVFEGVERPIYRINTFYRDGVPDVKVVYI